MSKDWSDFKSSEEVLNYSSLSHQYNFNFIYPPHSAHKLFLYRDKQLMAIVSDYGSLQVDLTMLKNPKDLYEFNTIVEKLIPIYKDLLINVLYE